MVLSDWPTFAWKMIAAGKLQGIIRFKELILKNWSKFSSFTFRPWIRSSSCKITPWRLAGLFTIPYEKNWLRCTELPLTGLLPIWSAKRIKELGADAAKVLLYYDIGSKIQQSTISNMHGRTLVANGRRWLLLFLEIVSTKVTTMWNQLHDAKVKPHSKRTQWKTHVTTLTKVQSSSKHELQKASLKKALNLYTAKKHYVYSKNNWNYRPTIHLLKCWCFCWIIQETLALMKEAGSTSMVKSYVVVQHGKILGSCVYDWRKKLVVHGWQTKDVRTSRT